MAHRAGAVNWPRLGPLADLPGCLDETEVAAMSKQEALARLQRCWAEDT